MYLQEEASSPSTEDHQHSIWRPPGIHASQRQHDDGSPQGQTADSPQKEMVPSKRTNFTVNLPDVDIALMLDQVCSFFLTDHVLILLAWLETQRKVLYEV